MVFVFVVLYVCKYVVFECDLNEVTNYDVIMMSVNILTLGRLHCLVKCFWAHHFCTKSVQNVHSIIVHNGALCNLTRENFWFYGNGQIVRFCLYMFLGEV